MATFETRGKKIRVKIKLQGVEDSKTFDNKTDARKWATQVESDIAAGKRGKVADKLLGDVFEKYKGTLPPERRSDRIRLTRIIRDEKISKVHLRDLNAGHVADWRDARLKKVSAASVLREWNIMSPSCNIAVEEWKWLTINPFLGVKRPEQPTPRHRRPAADELLKVKHVSGYDAGVETLTARSCAAFLFACETMMREGEICALRPEDVDFDSHTARVVGKVIGAKKTKNTRRVIPLSDEAERILKQVGCDFRLTAARCEALWRATTTSAGIDNLHFHDSRHEGITRNAQYMDVLDLARAAGIGDLKTLQSVYYNPTPAEVSQRFRDRLAAQTEVDLQKQGVLTVKCND